MRCPDGGRKNPLKITDHMKQRRKDEKHSIVVMMRPEDFSRLTHYPEKYALKYGMEIPSIAIRQGPEAYKDFLEHHSNTPVRPLKEYNQWSEDRPDRMLPIFLRIRPTQNPGVYRVVGHEGRHRVVSMWLEGEPLVEVAIWIDAPGYRSTNIHDLPPIIEGEFDPHWRFDTRDIAHVLETNIQESFQRRGRGSIPKKFIENREMDQEELIDLLESSRSARRNPRRFHLKLRQEKEKETRSPLSDESFSDLRLKTTSFLEKGLSKETFDIAQLWGTYRGVRYKIISKGLGLQLGSTVRLEPEGYIDIGNESRSAFISRVSEQTRKQMEGIPPRMIERVIKDMINRSTVLSVSIQDVSDISTVRANLPALELEAARELKYLKREHAEITKLLLDDEAEYERSKKLALSQGREGEFDEGGLLDQEERNEYEGQRWDLYWAIGKLKFKWKDSETFHNVIAALEEKEWIEETIRAVLSSEICPGDNRCRELGWPQGPNCSPMHRNPDGDCAAPVRRNLRRYRRHRRNPDGDCYDAAVGYMINSHLRDPNCGLILVHAEVTGQGPISGVKYGHAFILDKDTVIDVSNDRSIRMPKALYYHIGKIGDNLYKYTNKEMRKKLGEYGHYGPWDLETEHEGPPVPPIRKRRIHE